MEQSDGHKLSEGKFDAAYVGSYLLSVSCACLKMFLFQTYFAAEGFVYGSSRSNWQAMAAMAKRNSLEFIPSIGPGYVSYALVVALIKHLLKYLLAF